MPIRTKIGQASSVVALACVSMFSTNIAYAAPDATDRPMRDSPAPSTTGESPIKLHVRVDGELAPMSSELIDAYTSGVPTASPTEADQPNANLISFDQWIRCFTLNMFNDSYALYTHYWNGMFHDVRLKCGEGGDGGWGYKHIRDDKEELWQRELDTARSMGWISEQQGVESWDDLMAAITGVAITWPEYRGGNAHNNTSCGVVDVYFAEEYGIDVYSFRATAAWANDSDKLITSFPTLREVC